MTGALLTQDQLKEIRNLALANMDWGSVKLQKALSFKTSRPTVDRHMQAARRDVAELVQYTKGVKARELTEILRVNLEKDLGNLRSISWDKVKTAMGKPDPDKPGGWLTPPDEEALLTWFREATRTSEVTSRHLRAFDTLIMDNRDQSTHINVTQVRVEVAREILEDPLIPADLRDALLAKYTEGVEIDG